jgi:hypothetical protein
VRAEFVDDADFRRRIGRLKPVRRVGVVTRIEPETGRKRTIDLRRQREAVGDLGRLRRIKNIGNV